MTGVEADDRTLIPMMLQADYAALGPNGHRVDLTGCMLIAQVKGQLSTDRVVGKAVRLSCVRDNSQIIDVEVDGYLAGEDSTLGVVGQLISRQGRVLAAATIANLAKGAGEAIAAANTTSSLVASPLTGATGEVQNVTGNSTAYVAGSSVAGAAEDVADWYLSYAEKLTPAIAVGSGRDVWIVMLKSVEFAGLEVR
jgi:conjugal transfer pilus assembly protein TraB